MKEQWKKLIEERKKRGEMRRPLYNLRKLSIGLVSCMLGFLLFLGQPVTVVAGIYAPLNTGRGIQTRSVDADLPINVSGIGASNLRYAGTEYKEVDAQGNIILTHSKWSDFGAGWGTNVTYPLAGHFLLWFSQPEFYEQIADITVGNNSFTKVEYIDGEKIKPGLLWNIGIVNPNPFRYAVIGAVTNTDIKITLKDGKTLDSLGFADKRLNFSSAWITDQNIMAEESLSSGYILKQNMLNNGSTAYWTGGGENFTSGRVTQNVSFDSYHNTIRSVHTFKPDMQFVSANLSWVVYIREQIPEALLPYIDLSSIKLGVSNEVGDFTKEPISLVVSEADHGLIDSSKTPSISITDVDTSGNGDKRAALEDLNSARKTLGDLVFAGDTGQSRSYTIQYKLKNSVKENEFAKAINKYIQENNTQLNFASWMVGDYPDGNIGQTGGLTKTTVDNGAEPKVLKDSYTNSYLQVNDSDGDGLFDFTELHIGTNPKNYDSDGDGRSDGDEFLTDKTDPKDAKDFLVQAPETADIKENKLDNKQDSTLNISLGKDTSLTPEFDDAEDQKIDITSAETEIRIGVRKYIEPTEAGGVGSFAPEELQGVTDAKVQMAVEEFKAGAANTSLTIPKNTLEDHTRYVLVAFDATGRHSAIGTPFTVENIELTVEVKEAEKATEGKPVKANQTVVKPNLPNATISGTETKGLNVDGEGKLTGTPNGLTWSDDKGGANYEKQTVEIPVKVEANGQSETVKVPVEVLRDTDGDGTPDIADDDDDGDGISDEEEKAKGSDPKDAESRPDIPEMPDVTITNGNQSVKENQPIRKIKITASDPAAKVEVEDLPLGLSYDKAAGTISGTVEIDEGDWEKEEKEKTFVIPVTVTNGNGSIHRRIVLKVRKNADGEGEIKDKATNSNAQEKDKATDSNAGRRGGSGNGGGGTVTGKHASKKYMPLPVIPQQNIPEVKAEEQPVPDSTVSNHGVEPILAKQERSGRSLPKTGESATRALYALLAGIVSSLLLLFRIKRNKK